MQPAFMLQEVVQVQVALPESLAVQVVNAGQCSKQDLFLLDRKKRLPDSLLPAFAKTDRTFQKLEQHPAQRFACTRVQACRGRYALLLQSLHSCQFAVQVPFRLVTDK